jgi:hypothetical protein
VNIRAPQLASCGVKFWKLSTVVCVLCKLSAESTFAIFFCEQTARMKKIAEAFSVMKLYSKKKKCTRVLDR